MTIRIKHRAEITSEFIEIACEMAIRKLKSINKAIAQAGRQAAYIKGEYRGAIMLLAPIARGDTGAGVGLDMLKSRLRSLDYERFWVHESRKGPVLVGTTRHIRMETIGRGNKGRARYDAGQYHVGISLYNLVKGKTEYQVIPVEFEDAYNRHPHHRAYGPEEGSDDPFLYKVHTCWGSFGTPITRYTRDGNLMEIFKLMRIFAGRYYTGSPLVRIGSIPNIKELS
jgi:hypothetical protein